jgi:hypothetical protein
VDPGLHRLQGKAKGVKPTELAALLQECYRDRLALAERHRAVAVHVPPYDVNNTYQYIVNREETHLEWLAAALADLGAPLPPPSDGPSITIGRGADAWKALLREDAERGAAFVAKWRPRVDGLTHARNQTMLRLMLGEVQEQTRLMEQGAHGEPDLLGRGGEGAGKRGVVAGARWVGD